MKANSIRLLFFNKSFTVALWEAELRSIRSQVFVNGCKKMPWIVLILEKSPSSIDEANNDTWADWAVETLLGIWGDDSLNNIISVFLVKKLSWWISLNWGSGQKRPRAWCCGAGRAWNAPTTSPSPSWTVTSRWLTTWALNPWCCAPPCASIATAGYASRPAGKTQDGR